MVEQANFSELRNKISNWDLEAEEMLLNKIKIFTSSYTTEFASFTKNVQNFSNNLVNTQVEHYKAISNLKELSMNRFIEESLEDNPESVSEGSDTGLENIPKKEIILDETEKMKTAIDMSMKTIEEINAKKEKNKEQIEDDGVSIASKKLSLDNLKKYGNMPYIIGTDDFMKDKNIGLSNIIDEEEEAKEKEKEMKKEKTKEHYGDWEVIEESEDSDIEEFMADIPVDEKDKKKWEKIKKKKQKKKLKEMKKKQKTQDNKKNDEENNKNDFDEEVKEEIKVPIENDNKENDQTNNKEGDIVIVSGKGASVPPPPPPPPAPVFNPENIPSKNKNENKKEENINNKEPKNDINIQKENININVNNDINKSNNILGQLPPKPKNISVNPFLMKGLQNLTDDEDDDDDEGGLFSKKKLIMPKINNKINIAPPQMSMILPNNNVNFDKNGNIDNKDKLNNIFGEEKEELEKVKEEKELKEEDQKVEEDKITNEITNVIENKEAQEENNKINEEKEAKNENLSSQQIIKDISQNKKENFITNKPNNILDSLFEEEKNNSEEVKPKETQKIQSNLDNKKKPIAFFNDDDDD